MVISAVPWRAGKARRSIGAEPSEAEQSLSERPARTRRVRPMRSHGAAAATQDRFMDLVVLLSVVLFLVLAAGIGLLALQVTLPL